ncbi:MAG: nickel pincer cofactor biosynthesis protein LarC [Lachnospiraceae bacterium]
MKTLYLDCGMGAAGDMLTAALLELLPDREKVMEELNTLGIPGVEMACEKAQKCGIGGTHVSVQVNGGEELEEMYGGGYTHGAAHVHDHMHTTHETEDDHAHGHTHEAEQIHGHEHATHEAEHSHEHVHEAEYTHGHSHTHHHSGLHEIEHIVSGLSLSERIRKDILAVFGMIAEAESHVHGVPVTDIHFHEVGTMDAVADITAVCVLMDRLAPDQVIVSPVHVGSGQVKCAHGILPVPAPATAYILKDVPIYGGEIRGELCTPTGAALLKYFASRFGVMPVMRTLAIGYGMGKKDFPAANCVRALLGETEGAGDTVAELVCNVDDMTAEAIGFATETLLTAGALEVYTVAAGMKKSRPGTVLHVMCAESVKDKIVELIFKHTTTIGIRENISRRYTLARSIRKVQTPYGEIRKKVSEGYGVTREKYEYEDLARIARERGMSIREVEASL